MARDSEEIAATLRELARLDLVEIGQLAVLERIVLHWMRSCCVPLRLVE